MFGHFGGRNSSWGWRRDPVPETSRANALEAVSGPDEVLI
jgi:hypothetical protein